MSCEEIQQTCDKKSEFISCRDLDIKIVFMTDKYNKYFIGTLVFDKEKKRQSPLYFDSPILEKTYIENNNLDINKLIDIKDLIPIYLKELSGNYIFDIKIKKYINTDFE